MIKAKVSFDWDTLIKAMQDGKIKFEPPAITSHFREEMMRMWEEGRTLEKQAPWRDTGRKRPNYVRTPQLPEHPNMPMAFHVTTRVVMDYKAKVRELLGEGFERLTAQSVILDDHCMLLLEQLDDVAQAIRATAGNGGLSARDPLQIRRDQIRDEFAFASALILYYPEVQRSYEAKKHLQLGWHQLAYLALMPLGNEPYRDMVVRMYTECVVENADKLAVLR
jgi:hypothetical protein